MTTKPPPTPGYLQAATRQRIVALADLKPLPGNPRRGDIEAIKKSLERFGQRYPSVVRGDVLLAGNNRYIAMQELGWTHLVVVDADDLTDDEARAFAAADNRTADLAQYDDPALADWLAGLSDDLLIATGYNHAFLDDLLALTTDVPVVLPHNIGEPSTAPGGYAAPGPVDESADGRGTDLNQALAAWNNSGTRAFVLTYSIDIYRQLDAALARLRQAKGLGTNSDVIAALVTEADPGE